MDIRKLALGLGAFAAGAAGWAWGAGRYGDKVAKALDFGGGDGLPTPASGASASGSGGEHSARDLTGTDPVAADARAPAAFRPDPTAVPTEAEREALRPATGPAPTLVADRGSGFSEAAGAA